MRELCRSKGILINDDYTLQVGPVRAPPITVETKAGKSMGTKIVHPANEGFEVNEIRKDFPILGDIIYLDNAATSFSPEAVIECHG